MNCRVVHVSKTGDSVDFPDNNEFPHLIKEVSDEEDVFIVDENTEEYWPADEFFMMVDVKRFTITEK